MDKILQMTSDEFQFSTDKHRIDIEYVHEYLSKHSYWAQGIPRHLVERSIQNSVAVGVYHNGKQVGFARLITDFSTFGYLADVFIDESFRGRGLSKQLVAFIFSFDFVKSFRRQVLVTRDAHGLYAKYGFTPLKAPDRWMEKHQPDVYKLIN